MKPDKTQYQSSPVVINGDQGSCEFSKPIPPGHYRPRMNPSFFPLREDLVIPETPYPAVALHMRILPGRVGLSADLILRNERVDSPRTTPIQLEQSQQPAVLSRVDLEYPPDAKLAKISGTVQAEVTVNERGEVYEAKLLMSHPWFQKPGLDAIIQWKFQPMLLNGQPTPFVTTVNLDFKY